MTDPQRSSGVVHETGGGVYTVFLEDGSTVHTCKAALGYSFAAGTYTIFRKSYYTFHHQEPLTAPVSLTSHREI